MAPILMISQLDVSSSLLDRVQAKYAPPDHPVFQLSPPWFEHRAQGIYDLLKRPEVTFKTLWDVYLEIWPLLLEIQHEVDIQQGLCSDRAINRTKVVGEEETELLSSKWIQQDDLLRTGAFQEITKTRGGGFVQQASEVNVDRSSKEKGRKIIFAKGDEYVDYVSDLSVNDDSSTSSEQEDIM